MESWDEIKTAYHVARAGTVSGAADVLGVHHATVIRHIDALEARMGVKLFQRHARGYTATEAGADLLQVAQATDDQFAQLAGRIKGQGAGVSGELVVTSLGSLAPMLTPALVGYQQENPDIVVRFLTSDRVFRLEYGEAHVAVRAGPAPEEPDNVVQSFSSLSMAMVASHDYIARNGTPEDESALAQHVFTAHDSDNVRPPFYRWLMEHVPPERITFRATDLRVLSDAVCAGAGIGFVPKQELASRPELVEVMPPRTEWNAPLWLVTHVDLHRTAKVQSFLNYMKAHAKDWPA